MKTTQAAVNIAKAQQLHEIKNEIKQLTIQKKKLEEGIKSLMGDDNCINIGDIFTMLKTECDRTSYDVKAMREDGILVDKYKIVKRVASFKFAEA